MGMFPSETMLERLHSPGRCKVPAAAAAANDQIQIVPQKLKNSLFRNQIKASLWFSTSESHT